MEARLSQAVLLKKIVDAMKDLCKDVNFDCSEKGIQVQLGTSPRHPKLIAMQLVGRPLMSNLLLLSVVPSLESIRLTRPRETILKGPRLCVSRFLERIRS